MKTNFTLWRGVCYCIFASFLLTQFSCKSPEQEDESRENLAISLRARFDQLKKQKQDPALGYIPSERLLAAKEYVAKYFKNQPNTAVNGISWVERGPSNVGGRTMSLIFDKNDATNKTVLAGSASGGLWKNTNITSASSSWIKFNDAFDNLTINSICQDATNPQVVYVATSDYYGNNTGLRGVGIFKSTDGGSTFSHLTATSPARSSKFAFVYRLAIAPNGTLYAATNNDLSRSSDGGVTWTSVFTGGGKMADVAVASNGNVFASDWHGRVFKSTDGGTTWVNTNVPSLISSDYTVLGIAPSDPNSVYVIVDDSYATCGGIYRTTNGGSTWSTMTVPTIAEPGVGNPYTDFTGGQGWYDLYIAVDPNNASTIVVGGISICRSTNGGSTWTQVTNAYGGGAPGGTIHADQHCFTFVPGSSAAAVMGNDGGIFYSSAITTAGSYVTMNTDYNVTQFYACAAQNVAGSNIFLAGAQDNGTQKFVTAGYAATTKATGGDGAYCQIDPLVSTNMFADYVYSVYYKSTNSGSTWATSINDQTHGQFINPTAFDSVSKVMYSDYYNNNTAVGGSYARWLTTGVANTGVAVPNFNGAAVNTITVSPNTLNRVYFGLDNGSILYVDAANAGTTNKASTIIKAATTGVVSSIAIQKGSDNHILATYSNYGVPHIYETTNGGTSWTDISGNLPDLPVNSIVFYPGSTTQAIIGTDQGVWSTNSISGVTTQWTPTSQGMANVCVDMIKVRWVDNTLVAATHGRGMFTSTLTNTVTPQISFAAANTVVTEKSSGTTNNCNAGTTTVPVTVVLSSIPAGNVTVALAPKSNSTAVLGVDYTIPSNSVTFTPADYSSKVIDIVINDDDRTQGDRTIVFGYTVTSGSGNVLPGTLEQTTEVHITDDDIAPNVAYNAENPSGPITASLGPSAPLAYNAEYSKKTQIIYTAADLLANGVKPGLITSIGLNITSITSTTPYLGYTVQMGTTTLSDYGALTNFQPITGALTLFSGNWTPTFGMNYWPVPGGGFNWNGTSNIIVQWCFSNTTANAGTGDACDGIATTANTQLRYTGTTATNGCTQTASNAVKMFQPRIFMVQPVAQTATETALNSTSSAKINASGAPVYYFSSTGKILASIQSNSGFDYGCASVTIDRAGTSASQFWNTSPANYLLNKTFRVIPGTNNPSGAYTITLYYSAAEKTGWEIATGNSWNNIMLVKTANAISSITPATGGTAEIVTPVRGTFGTDYTLSYTFTSGFSGFGAGIPGAPLPVTLMNFTAQLQNGSGLLQWTTSNETNSKYFEVQRSVDGVNFTKIGTVNAAGRSSAERRYSLVDKAISAVNYYRIKMVDADNSSKMSDVRVLRNENINQRIYVLTNPFADHIDLRFAQLPKGNVNLRLIDLNGKLISKASYSNVGFTLNYNRLGSILTTGVYVLQAEVDGQVYSYKVVRQ